MNPVDPAMPASGSDPMTSRERLLAALARGVPDRLPVTTHHLMPAFLALRGGISEGEFFDRYGLDAIRWTTPLDPSDGCETDPLSDPHARSTRHVSETWDQDSVADSNCGSGRKATAGLSGVVQRMASRP